MGKLERDLLLAKQVLEGRWKVKAKLGGGGFGQVYRAFDSKAGKEVAIKVEPRGKKEVLHVEANVFTDLRGRPHCPSFFGMGVNSNINFLVMDVLGKNLSDLRRESPGATTSFSKRTTFLLGIQSLEAIMDMHTCGHLHRDVKPANFVMGLAGSPQATTCFLVDFGLARPLYDKNHNLRRARSCSGFRGTVKYASTAAHDGVDLGRKDDLWSLFYMLLEMGKGSLPWRKLKEKPDVGRAKKTTPLDELCHDLPPKMVNFGAELEKYVYETEPEYAFFAKLLAELLKGEGGGRNSALDWDEDWARLKLEQGSEQPHVLGRKASAGLTTGGATGDISPPHDDDAPPPTARTATTHTAIKPKPKSRLSVARLFRKKKKKDKEEDPEEEPQA